MTANLAAENARLRDRLADLEAENEWLKGGGERAAAALKTQFGLTPMESRLVLALARREQMSREQILAALYGDRPDDPPAIKILDVMVAHARAKLGRTIRILTVWGFGYRLDADDRAAVLALAGEAR